MQKFTLVFIQNNYFITFYVIFSGVLLYELCHACCTTGKPMKTMFVARIWNVICVTGYIKYLCVCSLYININILFWCSTCPIIICSSVQKHLTAWIFTLWMQFYAFDYFSMCSKVDNFKTFKTSFTFSIVHFWLAWHFLLIPGVSRNKYDICFLNEFTNNFQSHAHTSHLKSGEPNTNIPSAFIMHTICKSSVNLLRLSVH